MSTPYTAKTGGGSTAIVADDIRVSEERDGAVLSCRLRGTGLPERLWFKVPADFADALRPTGDALLPPLLVAAMRQGARLVIEGDVSAALLRASPAIMELFADASGTIGVPLRAVAVEARPRPGGARGGSAAGAFFSGGIDSFYTVLRNAARHGIGDPRRITHLITIHGFDVSLDDPALFAVVRDRLGAAAGELGMRLLAVTTNVRAIVAGIPWDYSHGAAMAGTGLALGRLVHTCYIPGSNSVRTCGFYGTHPGLDPLWSTETVEFINDGPMLGKPVKTPLVLTSPVALRSLRVCWENPGGAYNCGRCEKCLRTMVVLTLCRSLGRVETLPATIDLEALAGLSLPPLLWNLWQGLRNRLADEGAARQLVLAVDRALARSRRPVSAGGRAEAAIFRGLGRIGLTPPRIEALDQRVLRGRGVRAFRRLTGRD